MTANRTLSRAVALVTFLGALIMAPPLLADDSNLSVELNGEGTVLVIANATRNMAAVYRISGNSLQLISAIDLEKDMGRAANAAKASPPPFPTKDSPGQDPPDFRRPDGSVRIGSAHNTDADSENWSAEYLTKGTVPEVFGSLRTAPGDLQVRSEELTGYSAKIDMGREREKVTVTLRPRGEGVVAIEVQETRKLP